MVLSKEPFPLATNVLVLSAAEAQIAGMEGVPFLRPKLPESREKQGGDGLAFQVIRESSTAGTTGNRTMGRKHPGAAPLSKRPGF